nr:EAL domain-containing protein [Vibrio mexicanus]
MDSNGGDLSAVLIQALNILVGIIIYFPAIHQLNNQYSNSQIALAALDTSYTRRQEEAASLQADPIAAAIQSQKEQQVLEKQIELLSHQDFCLEYQPQISQIDKQLIGCEALIRGKDRKGNLVAPFHFLPWLEKADLMKDVDLWVFRQVVKDIQVMEENDLRVTVSVNVTPETLLDDRYMREIENTIKPFAHLIHFEITEETLLADQQKLSHVFNRLHQLGVKIHIDDFGTGYSSLSYLNQFPIDTIKIDRAFVNALANRKGQKVFAGILAIAERLEMEVVVEGVETKDQLNFIPVNDTITIQGWYYSRSLPLDKFLNYKV